MNKIIIKHQANEDEIDKTKSISELSGVELRRLLSRLRSETEAERLIFELKRNAGDVSNDYMDPPIIDTTTPIDQLYHYGVRGMKWGIRKDRDIIARRKKLRANRRTISNQQLEKTIKRLEKEKKLKELIDNDISSGKKKTEAILSGMQNAAFAAIASGVATAVIKAIMAKRFSSG